MDRRLSSLRRPWLLDTSMATRALAKVFSLHQSPSNRDLRRLDSLRHIEETLCNEESRTNDEGQADVAQLDHICADRYRPGIGIPRTGRRAAQRRFPHGRLLGMVRFG